MKKVLVYIVLSIVIMVPIVAIIVVSIVSQPSTTYSEHVVDDDSFFTDTVKIKNINEVITARGTFDSSVLVRDFFNLSEGQEVMLFVQEGDSVNSGDELGTAGNRKLCASKTGIILQINESSSSIVFVIKSSKVDRIRVSVPVELYGDIDNSSYSMIFDRHKYKGNFIEAEKSAQEDNTFYSYYELNGNSFILNGSADIKLKTGRTKKNAMTVKRKCVRVDDSGKYYIEITDNEDVKQINVTVGIIGGERVQISAKDSNEKISEGMQVIVGEKDVFIEKENGSIESFAEGETEYE